MVKTESQFGTGKSKDLTFHCSLKKLPSGSHQYKSWKLVRISHKCSATAQLQVFLDNLVSFPQAPKRPTGITRVALFITIVLGRSSYQHPNNPLQKKEKNNQIIIKLPSLYNQKLPSPLLLPGQLAIWLEGFFWLTRWPVTQRRRRDAFSSNDANKHCEYLGHQDFEHCKCRNLQRMLKKSSQSHLHFCKALTFVSSPYWWQEGIWKCIGNM